MSSRRSGRGHFGCVQRLADWGACSAFSERDTRIRDPVATMLAAAFLLLLAGCERNTLDRQMEELCKKDGGVKVYETVKLPASELETIWQYASTAKSRVDYYGPEYRAVSTREVLIGKDARAETGEGRLARLYWAIYRRSDDRLLGEQVEYRRNAGDPFTFGFQPSSAYCPQVERGLARSIFVKGD